ncbi:MAG: ribbon-helix-helix domain-containing protein, partial [Gammaproteobacteria bacterium]
PSFALGTAASTREHRERCTPAVRHRVGAPWRRYGAEQDSGMATIKITVTVPEELAAHIRREVEEGRYPSVSAFVTRAVESMRDFEPLDLLIASMIAETGEPDEAAEAWVERAMAAARRARLAEGGLNSREVA